MDFLRLADQRSKDGHQSAFRQLLELSVLYPFFGVGPGYYQMAGFWDRETRWADKTGHLSARAYRKAIERLNPMPYHKISAHKVVEKAIFRSFGIPSTEYLGFFNAASGCSANGHSLKTPSELAAFLGKISARQKVCFKPVEGWGGHGFEIADIVRDGSASRLRRVRTNVVMDVDEFCATILDSSHGSAFVLEGYLDQHSDLARFNPSSVNTLRLWVLQLSNSPPRLVLGYLRIGREGALVDNHSNGGIVAPIDFATGKLRAAIDGLPERRVFPAHPDHGARIEGQSIPFLSECLALAQRGLLAFPGIRFAGADVAVTEDGPCIIELNVSPDREGAAFVGVRSKTLLDQG